MITAICLLAQDVWAEDPQLKKAVAFTVDARGHVYVLEGPPEAAHDEASFDRDALLKRRAGPGIGAARVLRFEDADGDGRAEAATVFAEGLPAWSAGGILARGDEVWVASDPSIWILRDRDGDGKADPRKALFNGFGARLSGAGLRGPVQGPDGKLYFSSGDRGFSVVSQEGERLEYPEMGAMLRCDVDGANLEVFAIGLRNPQKPFFDEHGELFTRDDDRWIHVPEGSDHGWRAGADAAVEAAYILPPVARLKPERPRHLPVVMKGKGAGFEAVHGGALPPVPASSVGLDVEFDAEGREYFLEATTGRILRNGREGPDVRKLFADGLKTRTLEELAGLLGHQDRRVRSAAQQELVGRQSSTKILGEAAKSSANGLARIHAIWGLGQLYTRKELFPLLKDKDPEVRAQTARVLGDRRVGDAHDLLVQALKDENPRVRRYAATALGKLGRKEDGKSIAGLLRENDGKDAVLSHAGAHALAMIGSGAMLQELAKDASPAVRAGVLVAMRRLARPDVDVFLDDPVLALEAARAIHDLPIQPVLPRLAAKLGRGGFPDAALPLALNANVRLGLAEPVAAFAAKADAPEAFRLEALRALASWARPGPRDRVTGQWRPMSDRDPEPARGAFAKVIDVLRKDPSAAIRGETERTVTALR